ncbi:MAG: DsbE family thiol:disulfide interchange protein [Alphaproteobacteria bacterium]|nr:DsbE family thiol:disulfide interchange protein [Alphaproteobacteria bacterium]
MKKVFAMLPVAVFAVLVGFFIYRLVLIDHGDTPNLIPSVMIGRSAPAFDLPPLFDGQPHFAAKDLQGKVTLINFFASWCEACRAEHGFLGEVKQAGIRLIGIDYKDDPKDAKAWLARMGDPYDEVVTDADGRTAINFGLYGVPESYLIDKKGVIRFKQTGELTPDVIRSQVVPLARELSR